MKLYELFESTSIDEGLGKLAATAALAGATIFGAHNASASPKHVTQTQSTEIQSPHERANEFKNKMIPVVAKVNANIQHNRGKLVAISKEKHITPSQQAWLDNQLQEYNAIDMKDLYKRMDIVPPSLAVAQSAIESGWGSSDISKGSNAFFGQKAWTSTDSVKAPGGERYHTFRSPEESVASYIHNLNSHPAYEEFRDARAHLRKIGHRLSGDTLASTLNKYSTRGKAYTQQIQGLIRSHKLAQLD